MRTTVSTFLNIATLAVTLPATEFHVATHGNDANRGTKRSPLRTIQRAADLAQPGDVITVHAGVYRERINPPRGGKSDKKRIVYQAAPGEKVEIKGSEVITNWVKVQDEVWKVTIPNAFFGGFNPYSDLLGGDWFTSKGRKHHTGAVYLNGDWLDEAARLDEVLKPTATPPLWFAEVDKESTTIWAQFKGLNPNEQLVEINVRRTVFYPEKTGMNYITVRGFTLRHAATPWAPATVEQIGLIGTHWSKGWIIESNVVSHSVCSGITLGRTGDEGNNPASDTAEGRPKTVERAPTGAGVFGNRWNRETIGHHIVRHNTISHCEQAGIVGAFGGAFSTITGNTIHDIHVRRRFSGAAMAGIKFIAAIDTVIRGNHVCRSDQGLWLDWMTQGTRVSGNLFHDNAERDLFVEVNHGPFVVDNNLFLSAVSLLDMSQGGAYAHNLFAGKIISRPEPNRATFYHVAHSTAFAGKANITGGDNRFHNNILVGKGGPSADLDDRTNEDPQMRGGYGLWVFDYREFPLQTGGNVYYHGAQPYSQETNFVVKPDTDPKVKVLEEGGQVTLHLNLGPELKREATTLVTTAVLGKARIPALPYENADGSPLTIDTDYFGKKRNDERPTAGPFEAPGTGPTTLKVW